MQSFDADFWHFCICIICAHATLAFSKLVSQNKHSYELSIVQYVMWAEDFIEKKNYQKLQREGETNGIFSGHSKMQIS